MIPFSAEVYLSLLERYDAAIRPLPLFSWLLGLAALGLALRPLPGGSRVLAALLAAAWIWVGIVFHMTHFAAINWAALGFGPLFVLQGMMLLIFATLRGRPRFRARRGAAAWAGLVYALAALLVMPFLDPPSGAPWWQPRPGLLTPAPLTLFTLGLLLLTGTRPPLALLAIPFLWALLAGTAAWFLGLTSDLVLPPAAMACLALTLRRRRGSPT